MAAEPSGNVCPNCGATIKVLQDGSVGCEYCQTIIKQAPATDVRATAKVLAGVTPEPPPPTRGGMATTSLVLGILSLVCCGYLAAIPAIICGFLAMDSIKKGSLSSMHRGKAVAGIICGILSVILWTILLGTGALQNIAERGQDTPPTVPQQAPSQLSQPPAPPGQETMVPTESIPSRPKGVQKPPSTDSSRTEPAPESAKPLGSEQLLLEMMESHVRALAVAEKESTSLRKKMLTEESVTRTQKRLDGYVFAVTVKVQDAEYIDFYKSARVYITPNVDLAGVGDEGSLHFPVNSLDIKMAKTEAANIKQGNRLIIQGRILVGSPYKGGGLSGLQFYYKKASFAITEYTCRIAD